MKTFDELKNKKIVVTGATGLIGKALVKELVELGADVTAIVRNKEKFLKLYKDTNLNYIISDIKDLNIENIGAEYIVHTASITSSKAFVESPVETIDTAIYGTKRILEFAKANSVKSFVYLSSMEVYGYPKDDCKINECSGTNISTTEVRSSYPESKRMCEVICESYFSQYQIPIKIARLTQTFGPGVEYDDKRVFAEFARCVIENKDIILNTKGETKRSYLHVNDATNAILTILINGVNGEAYNVANEDTYCSILEMANFVSNVIANNKIKMNINLKNDVDNGYAPVLHMNLDTQKIQGLGWKPLYNLKDMYLDMIKSMQKDK